MANNSHNFVKFDLNAKEIAASAQEFIDTFSKKLSSIVSVEKQNRTWENTFLEFAELEGIQNPLVSSITFPAHVSTNKEVRDAANDASAKLEEYMIEIYTREDIYNALVECKHNIETSDKIKNLSEVEKRLMEKILLDFERNGLALKPEAREQVKQLNQEISKLQIDFQKTLNEDVTKLHFSKNELDGLPEDFLEALPKTEDGKYIVSLKYPELLPILEKCKVAETRRRMDFANTTKAMKTNTPILERIISLRHKAAQLLGYKNHAEFQLIVKMAKNSETVFKFLHDLVSKLEAPARKDYELLLKTKEEDCKTRGIPFDGQLHIYDWRFYEKILLQRDYQLNEELIQEYFPLDKVTEGLLEIYQQALSLKFREVPKDQVKVWHEDVREFEVYDFETGDFVGYFYLDLFPRDGKYGHAAEFDLQKRIILNDGSKRYPVAAMVANFTKPTAKKPSLLTIDEVETFFHEFGHVMHELCTTSRFYRFSGTAVERDFVEAPSQMLENWCYDKEMLQKMSGHYKDTSKPLPDDIIEKILKARTFLEPFKTRRQLHFGMFDMICHTSEEPVHTQELWHKLLKEIGLVIPQEGTNGAADFGHLTGGYSAGYYGYLWSLVYSSDMFLRFKKEGLLNKKTGKEYRDLILATGGTKDSMDVLVKFLGKEPSADAFLIRIGAKDA